MINKEFKIKRTSKIGKESTITFSFDDLKINFSIEGYPINLIPLLKIILKETKIYNTTYRRICPFKLYNIYNPEKCNHEFYIKWIDITSLPNEYRECQSLILKTDNSLAIENGEYKMFICDFLDLCVNRELLEKEDEKYIPIFGLDRCGNYERVIDKDKEVIDKLKEQGFEIPKRFNKVMECENAKELLYSKLCK